MSGFFFCGSIDDPVAYASASRTKPNSSVDHSTISSPMRERCTCVSAATKSASATKSRSPTASSELSNDRGELELGRDRRRVERQARTGERARAERRDVGAREAVAPAVDVARQRPEVREQVVRKQDRLRALQVRVARERDLGRLLGPLQRAVVCSSWMRRIELAALAAEVQAQVERDLVVAAAAGVQLGARVARDLGDAPLDRGVDVFVGRRERERAGRQLLLDAVERVHDRGPLVGRRAGRRAASMFTCAREPARSSAREPAVEAAGSR